MLILAFETSDFTASTAIMRDDTIIASHSINNTRTHSQTMLPMAESLMRECGLVPGMLDAIAVDKGPGSFTGVRIGVSCANAMSMALNIPVIGICSLDSLNQNASVYFGPVCTLIDARNDQIYAAIYDGGKMQGDPIATDIHEFLMTAPNKALFIGSGAIKHYRIITEKLNGATIAPSELCVLKAESLCVLARNTLKRGMVEKGFTAPEYMRPCQAERVYMMKNGANHGQ